MIAAIWAVGWKEMTAACFWTAAIIILYTYLGYPSWIYLRSRLRPRPWRRADIYPRISVIMAVHNGAALLPAKLDHLLSLQYPDQLVEVIVVSDGSTDGTNELLAEYSHPRLRAIIRAEHRGKAAAVNEGIRGASGEVLIFTDLRQQFEPNAIPNLLANFADPAIGCATGQLELRRPPESGGDQVTDAVGGLYWRYEQSIRRCEGLVDSVLGVSGAFYAVRRELAVSLPEGLILDDMYQPLSIARQGFRAVLDENARFSDALPSAARDEFQRKVRTLAGNFQLLQLAPWLLTGQNRLRFALVSHKLLRLAVPFLLIVTFATSALLAFGSSAYLALALAQVFLYVLAALSFGPRVPGLSRAAGAASAFCMLNAAGVLGLYRFLFTRKPLWKIWSVAPAAIATSKDRAEASVAGSH